MAVWTTIFFVFAFLGLILFLFFYARHKEKERTQQMQAIAAQLGWSFSAEAPLDFMAGLENFTLFSYGHGKQIKNMMYAKPAASRRLCLTMFT